VVEKAIIARLKADATVTALVAQRIYHLEAPPDTVLPYIVTGLDDDDPEHIGIGIVGLSAVLLEVYCYSGTNSEVRAIMEAVRLSLDQQTFTLAGETIEQIVRQGQSFDVIPPATGERRGTREGNVTFTVWYRESTS
jgi:hypothetical protein